MHFPEKSAHDSKAKWAMINVYALPTYFHQCLRLGLPKSDHQGILFPAPWMEAKREGKTGSATLISLVVFLSTFRMKLGKADSSSSQQV